MLIYIQYINFKVQIHWPICAKINRKTISDDPMDYFTIKEEEGDKFIGYDEKLLNGVWKEMESLVDEVYKYIYRVK